MFAVAVFFAIFFKIVSADELSCTTDGFHVRVDVCSSIFPNNNTSVQYREQFVRTRWWGRVRLYMFICHAAITVKNTGRFHCCMWECILGVSMRKLNNPSSSSTSSYIFAQWLLHFNSLIFCVTHLNSCVGSAENRTTTRSLSRPANKPMIDSCRH